MKQIFLACICGVLAVCGVLAGCARNAGPNNQAFDKASPEIKAAWDKAVAADKSNDYVAAITNYNGLMAKKAMLTEEQSEAVNAAALAINQRIYAAANNGDAAAKEASMKLVGLQSQH